MAIWWRSLTGFERLSNRDVDRLNAEAAIVMLLKNELDHDEEMRRRQARIGSTKGVQPASDSTLDDVPLWPGPDD